MTQCVDLEAYSSRFRSCWKKQHSVKEMSSKTPRAGAFIQDDAQSNARFLSLENALKTCDASMCESLKSTRFIHNCVCVCVCVCVCMCVCVRVCLILKGSLPHNKNATHKTLVVHTNVRRSPERFFGHFRNF